MVALPYGIVACNYSSSSTRVVATSIFLFVSRGMNLCSLSSLTNVRARTVPVVVAETMEDANLLAGHGITGNDPHNPRPHFCVVRATIFG
jgi:hypothetical protein